jgi:hypothetical protein
MRLRGPESSGIRAERSGSVRNPNITRDRGTKKEGAVGERVKAIGGGAPAQHECQSGWVRVRFR